MTEVVPFPRERLPEGWYEQRGKYHLVAAVRELRLMRLDLLREVEAGTRKLTARNKDALQRLDALIARHPTIR